MKNAIRIIAIIGIIFGVGLVYWSMVPEIRGPASVIDGDTLEIHGQQIRLQFIDAPESEQDCTNEADEKWRCGQKAALALDDFIDGRPVTCKANKTDKYNRLLAVCFAGGIDLNEWMVAEGWATAYRYYSDKYITQEKTAQTSGKGIWAGTFLEPYKWRKANK